MPNPYDVAFRERAVRAYEAGEGGYVELAELFDIGYRTLERWVAQYRATGSVAPRPRGGGWRSPLDLAVLHAVVRERPDGTWRELCAAYNRRVGRARRTTWKSFGRAMKRAQYVLKKNDTGRESSIGRTSALSVARFEKRSAASTRSGWCVPTNRA